MLDRTRDDRVGDSSESAGGIVLRVREAWGKRVFGKVGSFEAPACFVEGSELHGYAGSDSDERCEGAFVEG